VRLLGRFPQVWTKWSGVSVTIYFFHRLPICSNINLCFGPAITSDKHFSTLDKTEETILKPHGFSLNTGHQICIEW
jgi:hypothetical protein